LPTASSSVLGGVKIGSGVSITDGVISVSTAYAATSHSHSASDITSGTLSASLLPTSGVTAGTYTSVTVDTYGRVTAGSSPSIAYSSLTGLPTLGTAAAAATGDFAAASHNQAWSTITSTPTTLSGYGITDAASSSHTHAQLHDRSHAITSSSDHTATAWRVFYSDASGVVTELTLGSSGQALISQGASAAPTWGAAGSNSASDLTTGSLSDARLSSKAQAAVNLYLWSSFR
jgi:phage-related tail fiber protein